MLRRLLLLSLLLLSLAAQAGEACGEFVVAFYEHGILYYQDAQGAHGIDKDIVDEISRRSGCQFKHQLDSRVRIWAALEAGTLPVSVSGIATPERERYAQFLTYFVSRNYAVLSKALPASARTPEGFLRGDFKLGVVKGYRHTPLFDAWIGQLRAAGRVHEAADFAAVQRLLERGRVQAIVTTPLNGKLLTLGQPVDLLDWYPAERVTGGLILSRSLVPPEAVRRMEKALAAMRADGTLEAIYKRYVGPQMARDMVNF